jgi:hypothetical protein
MGCNSSSSAEVIDTKVNSPRPNPNVPTLKKQEPNVAASTSNKPTNRPASSKALTSQTPRHEYKLSYFDFYGRAEITRLLFAAGNIEYEDHRVAFDQWSQVKTKMPTEKVPVLEIDNQMFLVQSMAIARYVAKQASKYHFFQIFLKKTKLNLIFSSIDLYGNSSLQMAQIDAVVDTAGDLGKEYTNAVIVGGASPNKVNYLLSSCYHFLLVVALFFHMMRYLTNLSKKSCQST